MLLRTLRFAHISKRPCIQWVMWNTEKEIGAKAEETLYTGIITPLSTTKLMKWELNSDHHFELNPHMSFYPLFQNMVDNLKHNKPLNGKFLPVQCMNFVPVHAPPRCSSWVCGCGDIGISASQCVHLGCRTIKCVVSKSHQAHCCRITDFEYRSLCRKPQRNWSAIEIAWT